MAFQQQGTEGQSLTGCPINAFARFNRLALLFQLPRNLGIDAKIRRRARKRQPNFLQRFR